MASVVYSVVYLQVIIPATDRITNHTVRTMIRGSSEFNKRRRSSTEIFPNPLQNYKKYKEINMQSVEQGQGYGQVMIAQPRFGSPRQSLLGFMPMQFIPQPHAQTGSLITEADIQRIDLTTKNMVVEKVSMMLESRVAPLGSEISYLKEENRILAQKVDDLEMYSRRNCIRMAGVPKSEEDTTKAILEIAEAVEVPLDKSDIAVSHRVGKSTIGKPRQIISRIKNYDLKHELLLSNKTLKMRVEDKKKKPPLTKFKNVSISQDLTKERNNAAYEARQLVRAGLAKLTFICDGKIFIISNNDVKHKVQTVRDVQDLVRDLPPRQCPPREETCA